MLHHLSKRKIFAVCVAASLCSHIVSLLLLQRHSLWYSSQRPLAEKSFQLAEIEKIEKNQFLKESFDDRFSALRAETASDPIPETASFAFKQLPMTQPIAMPQEPPIPFLSSPHFPGNELAAAPQNLSFPLPGIEQINLFEHLPKDLIVPSPLLPAASLAAEPSLHPTTRFVLETPPHPRQQQAPLPNLAYAPVLLSFPLSENRTEPKFLKPASFPHLPDLPTLEDLETVSYSDYFDAEIIFSPLENEEGYLFALTLIPHPDLDLPKIRQHYSFLIDRSNSIQKERLAAVKTAVLKAIAELDLEDSFNIIAFDSKIDKFSPAPIPAAATAIRGGSNFLEQIQLGSFFSPANLYKPLFLTVPSTDDDLHTVILLTDGESLSKKTAQRELAMGWTGYNQGRVSLFAIGVGGDSHLATLDAATAFNRGKILYAPTKRGIKRKLLKLMKTISHPIAKNLSARGISRSSQSTIVLYPQAHAAPHLYLNEPYVILGTAKSLDPFILFVQGRIKNRWLNIKKPISFASAKKGAASLKAQWSLQRSYRLYEQYLYDLNPSHLAEARALLEPHDLKVAFQ